MLKRKDGFISAQHDSCIDATDYQTDKQSNLATSKFWEMGISSEDVLIIVLTE